ncbi:hypothetical protein [Synechococcus sp. W4D4]
MKLGSEVRGRHPAPRFRSSATQSATGLSSPCRMYTWQDGSGFFQDPF